MTSDNPTEDATGSFPDPDDPTRKLWQSGSPPGDALIGQTIGHYRIKRVIASGGMGTVYEAVQESPRRTVALKVMKQGIASKSALRRFEYESQILARLRHPAIAQVYEAGTHDDGSGGVPYFAMEYIPNAKPITEYARVKKRSTRERLELFTKVCDAVHHGHQKGIIHRDLKPGNILVDSHGQPKVIDFGVARATDSDMAITTLQTNVGQLIGTLQYMSPEQCDADPHDIDTRSDVYALGVVLYEMLCEQLPYDVTKVALHEVARVIREEPPTRPSSFNKTLRGDVETITLKALEKERDRRYHSAADLGADITRYLNNEPIIARPPSMLYQARTFARRQKPLVVGVAAVFVVLLAGVIVASTLYLQAEEARAEAVAARDAEAEQRRIAQENERLALEEAKRAELMAQFQATQLADINTSWMGAQLSNHILAKRRLALDAAGVDEWSIDSAIRDLESSLDSINFTDIAILTLEENIFARALRAIDEQFADQPVIRAKLLQTVADTLRLLGLLDHATAPQIEAIELRDRYIGRDHPDTLASISSMGVLLRDQGKFSEAEAYYLEAMQTRWQVLGDDHPDTLASINSMGVLRRDQNRPSQAEEYFREALQSRRRVLGNEHPDTLASINNMGILLAEKGHFDEAEQLFREALEIRRRTLGEHHRDTLRSLHNMGRLLHELGRLPEAHHYTSQAVELRRRYLGDDHPDTLHSINNLGAISRDYGHLAKADRLGAEAVDAAERVLPKDHWHTAVFLGQHARTLAAMKRFAEAEERFLEAHAVFEHSLDPDDDRTTGNIKAIADLYGAWHEHESDGGYGAKAAEWRAKLPTREDEPREDVADATSDSADGP